MGEPDKAAQNPLPGTGGKGKAKIDVFERGGEKDGERQAMNRRLFFQLLVYECPADAPSGEVIDQLGEALGKAGVAATVYENVNDPQGIGVLSWSEDPSVFVDQIRPVLSGGSFRKLRFLPEYTMIGRTYAIGYEQDLVDRLITTPAARAANKGHWAVWYPLRRKGAFNRLSRDEQLAMLREHGVIGRAYGEQGLAQDIRLNCMGLDKNDNDFVIALLGKELHPLSHCVQSMRKTRQTAEYIEKMGPFFVGRAAWSSAGG
jgi:chlorite dismutase